MATEELIKKLIRENNEILNEQKAFEKRLLIFLVGCFVIFATIIWLKY
jgi:hypothetical protein